MRTDYYVYILFRETGLPFYVGLGAGDRWRDHERLASRRKTRKDHVIMKTLAVLGEVPKIKIAEGLTRTEAAELEVCFIAAIGRQPYGPLTNLTAGGEGLADPSPETREKNKNALMKARARGVEVNTGAKRSKEARARMSKAKKGRPGHKMSPELREKLSIRNSYIRSPEVRARMSAAKLGRTLTPEHRAKIGAAFRGRSLTEEHKAKLRKPHKLREQVL